MVGFSSKNFGSETSSKKESVFIMLSRKHEQPYTS